MEREGSRSKSLQLVSSAPLRLARSPSTPALCFHNRTLFWKSWLGSVVPAGGDKCQRICYVNTNKSQTSQGTYVPSLKVFLLKGDLEYTNHLFIF